VSQETLVVKLPPAERAALRARLGQGRFEYRSVPHAEFSVKGEGVVATLYTSGKLVVQGADPALFLERFAGGAAPTPARRKSAPAPAPADPSLPTVGSDETGKGDYFGPLVVCAARVEPELAAALTEAGVMDSKRLTDPRALQLAALLRERVPHALRVLMPEDYNRDWKALGLHTLLSRQHAEVIREVAHPGDRVVVDQFAKKDEIGPRLADLGLAIEQRPRAESEVAVAAASILARAEFLLALKELGDEYDLALHKGAGAPVDRIGVEFVRAHGRELLPKVAKTHFKNTEKIERRLAGRR
jgi:ribonuclease HIII